MVRITLEFDDLDTAVSALNQLHRKADGKVIAAVETEAVEVKKPQKAEAKKPEAAAPTPTAPVTATPSLPEVAPPTPALESPSDAIEYSVVKKAVLDIIKVKGNSAVESLLAEFGVKSGPALKPDQYPAVLARAKELVS
jgi:hypothetical protein